MLQERLYHHNPKLYDHRLSVIAPILCQYGFAQISLSNPIAEP